MTDENIIAIIRSRLAECVADIAHPASRRIFLTVEPGKIAALAEGLKREIGLWYIATISGVDLGDQFEILYHFGHDEGSLTVRTRIPRSRPEIESITPVFPGAILYERELQDMFGIVVAQVPDPRPLVVPDGWPAGNYPLRKDWAYERPAEVIPGGKK